VGARFESREIDFTVTPPDDEEELLEKVVEKAEAEDLKHHLNLNKVEEQS
jgi:hypothetical protein